MFYGSKAWCPRENEMATWKTEKAMIRAMRAAKLIKKRSSQELMNLEENLDR